MTRDANVEELDRQLRLNLGVRIRRLRQSRGWNEDDLARVVAAKLNTAAGGARVRRLESGRGVAPMLAELIAYAEVLNVPVDKLLRLRTT